MQARTDTLSLTFAALADPTRRAILARLAEGDANVAELTAPFPMSQPAISRHLKVLERAGLISRSRRATARLSHLEAAPLRDATEWLARLMALVRGEKYDPAKADAAVRAKETLCAYRGSASGVRYAEAFRAAHAYPQEIF